MAEAGALTTRNLRPELEVSSFPHRVHIIALLALIAALPAGAQEPPVLRYTSWMLLPPGEVSIASRPYGMTHEDFTYPDQPSFSVIALQGETLQAVDGRLGQTSTVAIPPDAGELALLRLTPGNNYAVPRPATERYWYIATPEAPLNTVGGFEELYFWLPPGLSAGTVFCHAFSVGEAGWLVVTDLEGALLGELESDFNEPEALLFRLPAATGPEGAVLRLALLAPRNPGWTVDDAKLWLGPEIPGLLAPNRAAAETIPHVAGLLGIATEWTLLRDFEGERSPITTIQWSRPVEEGAALPAYDVRLSDEQALSGRQSLRVELRFPEGPGDANELKLFTEPLEVASVRRLRFFLFGDGSGRNMIVRVRDAAQEHYYVNVGPIDWVGWKAVVADFTRPTSISGGDENKRIDGPPVSVVVQIQHGRANPAQSVLFIDDLAVEGSTP